MRGIQNLFAVGMVAGSVVWTTQAFGADAELDALNLEAAPPATEQTKPAQARVYGQMAAGVAENRYGQGRERPTRVSLDVYYATRLTPAWRAFISDRVDQIHPPARGTDSVVNTLREAYATWQDSAQELTFDMGRVNLRTGPAYGFNPTDFFRAGSVRASVSTDPIALRDSRMGTVAVRAQKSWLGGSIAAVFAPKLSNQRSNSGLSLDLGSTNDTRRGMLTMSQQFSNGIEAQWLAYKSAGNAVQWGGSATFLVTDATVAFVEGSTGRERSIASRAWAGGARPVQRTNRFAGGFTLSLPGAMSVTTEVQHNGAALDSKSWVQAFGLGGAERLGAYLLSADQAQDLAARKAVLLYLTKKGFVFSQVDATFLIRMNTQDHSKLTWFELRTALRQVEFALQLQQNDGGAGSEYGLIPTRRSAQAVLTYRF